MALQFHERECCIAIVRFLEDREGAKFKHASSPELARDTAPVELVIHLGARDYAIEHTGIEPFSGFVRMTSEADWRLSPIETEVRKRLSDDATFQLALPIGALAAQKGKALRDAQAAVIEWVISTVPKLPEPAQLRGSFRPSSFERTEMPFQMRLDRLSRPLPGISFFVVHYTNETSLEQLRRERIREMLRKKLPKLQIWASRGARTVLILEDNDIAVTNEDAYPVDSGCPTCCVLSGRNRAVSGTPFDGQRSFAFPVPEGVL